MRLTTLAEGRIISRGDRERPELVGRRTALLCSTHRASCRLPHLPVDSPPSKQGSREPGADQMRITDLLGGTA